MLITGDNGDRKKEKMEKNEEEKEMIMMIRDACAPLLRHIIIPKPLRSLPVFILHVDLDRNLPLGIRRNLALPHRSAYDCMEL